jgi:hypothetical protein
MSIPRDLELYYFKVIRHSSLKCALISRKTKLTKLLKQMENVKQCTFICILYEDFLGRTWQKCKYFHSLK